MSKPLDLLQSLKVDIKQTKTKLNKTKQHVDVKTIFTQIVHIADGEKLCVSLSCSPICWTSAGLSDICGNVLLVRFSDTDDGIAAHINETLSL